MSKIAKDNWVAGGLFAILISIGGWMATTTHAAISTLEGENVSRKVENATIKQDLQDFRQSFEEFKNDVKADLQRHHK